MKAITRKTLRKTSIWSLGFALIALVGACGDAGGASEVINESSLQFEMMPPHEVTHGTELSFFSMTVPAEAQVAVASGSAASVSVKVTSGDATLTGTLSRSVQGSMVVFDDLAIEGNGTIVVQAFLGENSQPAAVTEVEVTSDENWSREGVPAEFSTRDIIDESRDMRHVLLAGVAGSGNVQLYLYDRKNLTTALVSIARNGSPAGVELGRAQMSSDGRYIAYTSAEGSLVANDSNQQSDVFVYDRESGKNHLVSRSVSGTPASGESELVEISSNGRYITFTSDASDLITNAKGAAATSVAHHTYRMDLAMKTVERVDGSSTR